MKRESWVHRLPRKMLRKAKKSTKVRASGSVSTPAGKASGKVSR